MEPRWVKNVNNLGNRVLGHCMHSKIDGSGLFPALTVVSSFFWFLVYLLVQATGRKSDDLCHVPLSLKKVY